MIFLFLLPILYLVLFYFNQKVFYENGARNVLKRRKEYERPKLMNALSVISHTLLAIPFLPIIIPLYAYLTLFHKKGGKE